MRYSIDKIALLYYSIYVEKNKRKIKILWVSGIFCAVIIGCFLGFLLALTINTKNNEHFTEFAMALPTKLLDINGELITEFASDEKREVIEFSDLPQHMIDALITREDNVFFEHFGFTIKSIVRAAIGELTGRNLGGGSTLTQQIAGTLYLDRTERSIIRKIKELWFSIQMERRYSKEELLELYLNEVFFGGGTYGVNSASKYYFGHGAEDITPAEAAILVIQLSTPTYYNPFEYPNRAQDRQKYVLEEMTVAGYLTEEEAQETFDDFWLNFDYTRTSSSAYFLREDKAPWFSEYARRELENMMYGTMDVYTDGYTVHTTMDMKHQLAAQDIMTKYIADANKRYQSSSNSRHSTASKTYVPMTELLSLIFDIPQLKVSEQRNEIVAMAEYKNEINPVLDVLSLMFGIEDLKVGVVNRANVLTQKANKKTTIEGTMVNLENSTGYITALVGGSEYSQDNQFIRATQALLQPGSVFKPLFYTAAIDSKKFTQTTVLDDSPYVFENADGTPYIPQNFMGTWDGAVQLWYALATSMNVPTLKVMQGIGFDAAITQTAELLGIQPEEYAERNFEPVYPFALGVSSVLPIEMAQAFAIFANQGVEVVPMAIRSIEDRNGKVILEPERELRLAQQERGEETQIISPQTAYIMADLLRNTVKMGTLARSSYNGKRFEYENQNGDTYILPAAGKTGTTQNWADAWAVGFTPYYTSAFWFGFDSRGQSLGLTITGSTLAGWAWSEFMYIANEDVSYKPFAKPASGLVDATVCSVSGHILTSACGNSRITKTFLVGTQPTVLCEYHSSRDRERIRSIEKLEAGYIASGVESPEVADRSDALVLDLSFLDEIILSTNPTSSTQIIDEQNTDVVDSDDIVEQKLPSWNSLLD